MSDNEKDTRNPLPTSPVAAGEVGSEQQNIMSKSPFSDYTVQLSTEPSYYGSTCTCQHAVRIVRNLTDLIERQFPGITVDEGIDYDRSSSTTGPDEDTVEQINQWIDKNWTAAL